MIPVGVLKKDLFYNRDLKDILDILKVMSSSEFSRTSAMATDKDVLKKHLISCFKLLGSVSPRNPYLTKRENLPEAFLLVCSDQGFLGDHNNRILKMAMDRGLDNNSETIVLGEMGEKLLEDSGIKCKFFPAIGNDVKMEDIGQISDYVMKLYKKKQVSAFSVIYTKFNSFTNHHTEEMNLLPCEDIKQYLEREKSPFEEKVLIEPSSYHIVEYLVKMWLENNIYNVFWSSKLSEWAMRVINLDHNAEELKDITKSLRFKYFKSVHAMSDKVIREIFAARAAR
ncbi:MAG: FoF1 ATP synthase subunit gamma [Candidatus Omnitrophota bacterium]